jgi:hypothetical protein
VDAGAVLARIIGTRVLVVAVHGRSCAGSVGASVVYRTVVSVITASCVIRALAYAVGADVIRAVIAVVAIRGVLAGSASIDRLIAEIRGARGSSLKARTVDSAFLFAVAEQLIVAVAVDQAFDANEKETERAIRVRAVRIRAA